MKYLLIFSVIFIVGCKQKTSKKPNVQKINIESKIPDTQKINIESKTDTLIIQRDFHENIDIAVCTENEIDTVLYQRFIEREDMTFSNNLWSRLFRRGDEEKISQFLLKDHIDCMVSLYGNQYYIFNLYYKDIQVERVYENILDIDKDRHSHEELRDFFKRGLVFIFNEKQNKLTILAYNPFADNAMPARVASYFKGHATEFDRVVNIVGMGHIDFLID